METRNCQNCKKDFIIEPDDFGFYEKVQVPPPTFCPDCRYKRRIACRNVRRMFRAPDAATGKELFTGISPEAGISMYEMHYWNSDAWDPLEYGREYDFSRPFFEQFKELLYTVPWPAKSMQRCVNSDYSNMCDDMKNSYLCFNATFMEDCAYCCNGSALKKCYDLTSCYNDELCYDNVRVDKSYRCVGSVNAESCVDVWFSKNCVGCTNCFGCVNLRNSSYKIFNEQYTKEEYAKKIESLKLDTWEGFSAARQESEKFWRKYPIKYMLGFRNLDVTGEDIKDSKNVKQSYIVQKGENLKYVQDVPFGGASNSYDYTCWGISASLLYECMIVGEEVERVKFCHECWPVCQELEYSIHNRRCRNCFGCVGLKDKQYCIFNKQYTKEEYEALVPKIKKHMDEIPYIDKRGCIYKYGEFFPSELSPFAYNETLLVDQFPITKKEAESQGFFWREPHRKEYQTTLNSKDLPQSIKDTNENIIKELIECRDCKKAYRILPDEFNFLKGLNIPLPRFCVDCRFVRRQKCMVPPVFRESVCMCAGGSSGNQEYKNIQIHELHGNDKCTNSFLTAYDSSNEVIYCEECYKKEVF